MDRQTVEWICEELPPWIKFPDFERVEWLNKLVAKLWPHISNATGTTVLDVVGPILKKSVPKGLASVEFTKLTLGTLAPQFGGIKAFNLQSSEIILDLNIKWGGDPDIVLSVKPSLLAYSVGLPIQLTDFQLFGTMRIVLSPLLDAFPCFGALSYAFIEDPHVDFTLNVASGDIMSIPGLNSMIDNLIKNILRNICVWPKRGVVPIVEEVFLKQKEELEGRPIGILFINVKQAKNLPRVGAFSQKGDPMVMVNVAGSLKEKTTVKHNSIHPIWGEVLAVCVYSPLNVQYVDFEVYNGKESSKSLMCKMSYPLKLMEAFEVNSQWHDLHDLNSSGAALTEAGTVLLDMMYKPFVKPHEEEQEEEEAAEFDEVVVLPTASSGEEDNQGEIAFSKMVSGRSGALFVELNYATDLVEMDSMSSSDPVVYLSAGTKTFHSKTYEDELNPQFNEKFEFVGINPDIHPVLKVQVFDVNTLSSNRPMGEITIPMSSIVQSGQLEETWALEKVQTGKVNMRLRWMECQVKPRAACAAEKRKPSLSRAKQISSNA